MRRTSDLVGPPVSIQRHELLFRCFFGLCGSGSPTDDSRLSPFVKVEKLEINFWG